tara:strand:- start:75 stop:860 length:786 start_codon:yes stop_codon:yes gene_type:complete
MFHIVILLFIFVVIIFNIYKYFINRKGYNNVILLSREETLSIILNDNDNYYSKFTDKDLKVRKVSSISEYKNKIKNSVCDGNKMIKTKIMNSINKSNEKINKLNIIHNGNYKGIDLNKLYNIKWKIGFICNNSYEDGLPHTRNDTIIIPMDIIYDYSSNRLCETLIHEKVHIYQKLFQKETEIYLKENNFEKIKKIDYDDNIRANPDIDDNIYRDQSTIYKASYLPNAVSIHDVRIYSDSQKYEHPFEHMAIILSEATNNL